MNKKTLNNIEEYTKMAPINSPFDFNRDGNLDAAERFMELMIYQEATLSDDNDKPNDTSNNKRQDRRWFQWKRKPGT